MLRWALSLGVALAGSSAVAASCDDALCPVTLKYFSRNLVTIKGTEEGVGMAVAFGSTEVWFATPAHVVYGESTEAWRDSPPRTLSVISADGAPLPLCERPASNRQRDLDLTFVCVKWSNRPSAYVTQVLAGAAREGERGVLLGRNAGTDNVSTPGSIHVGARGTTPGPTLHIDGVGVVAGQSGALLVGEQGVLGMFLNSSRAILDMDTIKAEALHVGVPWMLQRYEYFEAGTEVELCAKFGDEPERELTLKDLRTNASVRWARCTRVAQTTYAVQAFAPDFECQPRILTLNSASEPHRDVGVSCKVNVNQRWVSEDAGVLSCVEIAPSVASCTGLEDMRNGSFQGTATGRVRGMSLDGAFITMGGATEAAHGEFEWNNGELAGTLAFGGLQRGLSFRSRASTASQGCGDACAGSLVGTWEQADFRGFEQHGQCARVWLERRTYIFGQVPGANVTGTYLNELSTMPVGIGIIQDCSYAPPATRPLSAQARRWTLELEADSDGWQVVATPAPSPPGNMGQTIEPFETHLRLEQGGRLSDGRSSDAGGALAFRTDEANSSIALDALDAILRKVNGTDCIATVQAMPTLNAPDICATFARAKEMFGAYESAALLGRERVDRIRDQDGTRYLTQDGYFLSFNATYGSTKVPGQALITRRGDSWTLRYLWHIAF